MDQKISGKQSKINVDLNKSNISDSNKIGIEAQPSSKLTI